MKLSIVDSDWRRKVMKKIISLVCDSHEDSHVVVKVKHLSRCASIRVTYSWLLTVRCLGHIVRRSRHLHLLIIYKLMVIDSMWLNNNRHGKSIYSWTELLGTVKWMGAKKNWKILIWKDVLCTIIQITWIPWWSFIFFCFFFCLELYSKWCLVCPITVII